jgi:hypothetical protein
MLEVVSDVCGLHAQVMSSAEMSAWTRVDALKYGDVQKALWTDRKLVKTWMVRGTLHLVTASDYPLWQGTLSAYDHYLRPSWLKYFDVTEEGMLRTIAAIGEALQGDALTRDALARRVGEITGSAELGDKLRQSWGTLLKPATYLGHVCFAPSVGQLARFTRPDKWIGRWGPVDRDMALRETTRRYFAMNGPATWEDFAHWAGLPAGKARKRIAELGEDLADVAVNGAKMYVLREHLRDLLRVESSATVRLLPAFDQFVVGASRHAQKLLPTGVPRSVVYRAQGWLSPVLLVDGRMDGLWSLKREPKGIEVVLRPFGRLPKKVRTAAEHEAERLADFYGAKLEFKTGAVA